MSCSAHHFLRFYSLLICFLCFVKVAHSTISFARRCLSTDYVGEQKGFAERTAGSPVGHRRRARLWRSIKRVLLPTFAWAIQSVLWPFWILRQWYLHSSGVTLVRICRQLSWLVRIFLNNIHFRQIAQIFKEKKNSTNNFAFLFSSQVPLQWSCPWSSLGPPIPAGRIFHSAILQSPTALPSSLERSGVTGQRVSSVSAMDPRQRHRNG